MLLRFAVENFKSFSSAQEIVFASSALVDEGVDLIPFDGAPKGTILPAMVVYGANASGKSNLVGAIARMRDKVLNSHRQGKPKSNVSYDPFLLDNEFEDMSTKFDMDFVIDNVRYNYGFEFNGDQYTGEWLFSFPKKLPRMLFERSETGIEFGRHLKGRNSIIWELTRENSLFLSAATQNHHEELTKVAEFFEGISIQIPSDSSGAATSFLINRRDDGQIASEVIECLKELGTGVTGYRLKKDEYSDSEKKLSTKLLELLSEVLPNEADELAELPEQLNERREIQLSHKNVQGEDVYFDLSNESAGTRGLLASLPKVLKTLNAGGLIVFDELDLSLHTKAAEFVLKMFASKETNPHGAQLLATTHDTNLLDAGCLRRDQIWFTEKDAFGSTEIYPLTDISTRKSDNIERGYLQGRYGAIPVANH